MRKIAFYIAALGLALSPLLVAAPAHAQATRTWVSGVGDDANPCSRTAPCKTFAGAISKTAVGGEINCLDPGGFGAVTITKSLTIDCHEVYGSVLVAGTNAIVIPFDSGYEVWVYRWPGADRTPRAATELVLLFEPSGLVKKQRVRPGYPPRD